MGDMNVGIRELKARLSHYLRQVKLGKTILITEYGNPVGRIVPAAQTINERMNLIKQAGMLNWDGSKIIQQDPVTINRGQGKISDLISEMRK